jgi:hypothetical protein
MISILVKAVADVQPGYGNTTPPRLVVDRVIQEPVA